MRISERGIMDDAKHRANSVKTSSVYLKCSYQKGQNNCTTNAIASRLGMYIKGINAQMLLFQTCMFIFLLRNAKNVGNQPVIVLPLYGKKNNTLFFYVLQKKDTQTGFGNEMKAEFSF